MRNLKWKGHNLFLGNLPIAQFLYSEGKKRYEIYDALNNIFGFNDMDRTPEEAKKVFRRLVKKSIKGEIKYLQK